MSLFSHSINTINSILTTRVAGSLKCKLNLAFALTVKFYVHLFTLNSTSKQSGHPDWSLWNRSKECKASKSFFIQEQNPVSDETVGGWGREGGDDIANCGESLGCPSSCTGWLVPLISDVLFVNEGNFYLKKNPPDYLSSKKNLIEEMKS